MLKVYGADICKDCLAMKVIFKERHVKYEYISITDNTTNMREFFGIRDQVELYAPLRTPNGAGIGIPLFIKDDRMTFDIREAMEWEGMEPVSEAELQHITDLCEKLVS